MGIDQHRQQLTVPVRDDRGEVVLRRQVSTQWDKVRAFLDDLNARAAPTEGWFANVEVCGFNDWLLQHLRARQPNNMNRPRSLSPARAKRVRPDQIDCSTFKCSPLSASGRTGMHCVLLQAMQKKVTDGKSARYSFDARVIMTANATRPLHPHPNPLPQSPGFCFSSVVLWASGHAQRGRGFAADLIHQPTRGRWGLVRGGAGARILAPFEGSFWWGAQPRLTPAAHTEVPPPGAMTGDDVWLWVVEVDHEDRDVVAAAAGEGQVAQQLGRRLGIGLLGQRGGDRRI
jgi:hypothetical protein